MNEQPASRETYRVFLLMSELEAGVAISQRELAGRLGIAVGLVNSYLKHFVAEGYVRVKAFPRNRYAYQLTQKGVAEKGRLAFQQLKYFAGLYAAARREYLALFLQLKAGGVNTVIFCGVDDVAEIAYLSLQEAGLSLWMVVDGPESCGRELFGTAVQELSVLQSVKDIPLILTSLTHGVMLKELLKECAPDVTMHEPAALLSGA